MIPWSERGRAFPVPAGALDVYQSIQRLEPGAWVAAHTHEGPESGVVTSESLTRFEAGERHDFAAGATFCTLAGTVHSTGNSGGRVAEAITLHMVAAGSGFSTPCACPGAPAAAPGSTNPARSIVRDFRAPTACVVAQHARIPLSAIQEWAFSDTTCVLVTVLAGSLRIGTDIIEAPQFRVVWGGGVIEPAAGMPTVLLTRLEFASGGGIGSD